MGRYIARKLVVLPIVMIGVSFIIFFVVRAIPGDPARLMAGTEATQEQVMAMRRQLGLDRSILFQYGVFLQGAVRGDLGNSINSGMPVVGEISRRIPYTLQLTFAALLVASVLGISAGVLAAVYKHSWVDQGVMLFAIIGASAANFWVALMAMSVFSVQLGWLPLFGADTWRHMVLPTFSLCVYPLALIARMSRSSMLEVVKQDYVRTAQAKGVSKFVVYTKHALRNALIPVITLVGLHFGVLLGGAVVTETVFSWPGVGRLLVDAVRYRDYPIIQGTVLFTVLSVVLVNFLVDIVLAAMNPRMRFD